jgi:citrate synthase
MSKCKLDHTNEDVRQKYQSQLEFLPKEMHSLFETFFADEHPQHELNELFHLLKKYDLISESEKAERNQQMLLLLNNK